MHLVVGSPVEDGVVAGKVHWKIFSCNRGGLMATNDSRDEGGVAGVRYDHYMGCQSWNHGKTLTRAFHGSDTM